MSAVSKWVRKAYSEIFDIEAGDRQLTRKDKARLLDAVDKAMESEQRTWAPSYLELLVSEDCNLRCDYCFMETKNPRMMTQETGKQCVDFLLRECGDEKKLGILFFGGEPLQAFPTIRAIVEYADSVLVDDERSISYSVTTNGTLFTEDILDFFAQHKIVTLLSIDGPPEVHNTHRKTCTGEGSYALIAEKLPLISKYLGVCQVRVTPHPDTVGSLYASIEHLVDLGFNNFIIGPAHGIRWSQAVWDVYNRQMKRIIDSAFDGESATPRFVIYTLAKPVSQCSIGCRAGKKYLSVGADGRLAPCSLIMGTPGLADRYVFGNVQEGFTDRKLQAEFNLLQSYRSGECKKCDTAEFCAGGCPGNNHKETGSILHPADQQCQDLRYRIQHQNIWQDYAKAKQNAKTAEHVSP